MPAPILYIVIPCYNEQEVLPVTSGMFLKKLKELAARGKIHPDSRILFVNDGSKDDTWQIITGLSQKDPFSGHCTKPQPRASECCARRAHGSEGPLRHHHQYRLRRPG